MDHLTWKFQTVLRSLQKLLGFINDALGFLKSVKDMFKWFSERQLKPCSALLFLDGQLCSSPQHVIIHDLVIPDERQVH